MAKKREHGPIKKCKMPPNKNNEQITKNEKYQKKSKMEKMSPIIPKYNKTHKVIGLTSFH